MVPAKVGLTTSLLLALACQKSVSSSQTDDSAAGGGAGGQPTSEAGHGYGAGGVGTGDGGAGVAGSGGATPCAEETRATPYSPAMIIESETGFRVTLIESAPAPRVGSSAWSLEVRDPDGKPVEGASLRVTPFMPDHRHGSTLTPVVDEAGDGSYVADPVHFTMTGYWRITVRVATDEWTESAVFPLCIE
jgi:hypothetical protein